MGTSKGRKKFFLLLGPSIPDLVSKGNSLFLPESVEHDSICSPASLKNIPTLCDEIVESSASKVFVGSDIILPHFFSYAEKINHKSMWQGDAIRKMILDISKTHDVVVVYYMKPVFEHLLDSYALRFKEKKREKIGQESFDNFCNQSVKRETLHYKNVESWANIPGVESVIVRPYVDKLLRRSSYYRDVFSVVGVRSPWKISKESESRKVSGIYISENVVKSYEDVYEDNREACDKFLSKKQSKIYLETFYPHYGELKLGLGTSFKRFFGF